MRYSAGCSAAGISSSAARSRSRSRPQPTTAELSGASSSPRCLRPICPALMRDRQQHRRELRDERRVHPDRRRVLRRLFAFPPLLLGALRGALVRLAARIKAGPRSRSAPRRRRIPPSPDTPARCRNAFDAQMKIATPTNRIADQRRPRRRRRAQISVVIARPVFGPDGGEQLVEHDVPPVPAQRRQAAPNRKPMPATIASVA